MNAVVPCGGGLPAELAAVQTGWAVLWIAVALVVVVLIALAIIRFGPDFVRYMRIKKM